MWGGDVVTGQDREGGVGPEAAMVTHTQVSSSCSS